MPVRGFGIVLMSGPYRKELSADFRLTTNDRVELMTVIVGLREKPLGNSRLAQL